MNDMRKLVFLFYLMTFLFAYAADSIRVACVGNGITYGVGVKDRDKDSYPAQLQSLLGNRYNVGNFGKSGATLLNKRHRPYIKQKEYKEALEFNADIVIIHFGINDTDASDWPYFKDNFIKDYISLIESFKNKKTKTRIIIASITPIWNKHPRFLSRTKVWQDEIRKKINVVADICNVELIDFYSILQNYPFMFPDAVHPNEEGSSILAKTVYSAITGNYGGLKMANVYGNNMVIQRDVPFKISGTSNAKDRIIVKIEGRSYKTITSNRGEWSITIDPLPAISNTTMSVYNGSDSLIFKNIAVGEVWLCSGQSNMEFMLKSSLYAQKELSMSDCSSIRLFNMQPRWRTNAVKWTGSILDSINHLEYYKKTYWEKCNPESAKDFSAVAYHFGKMLHDSLNVPIGLICNAIGGSTTESWIDRNTLENKFHPILYDWKNNDLIQKWVRDRALLNINNSKSYYQRHPYEPCYLFESGINTLNKYPIKGVIWYQGESNAHNVEAHEKLFKLLVESWRNNWENKTMPFYFVQLSSLSRPSWPMFRDSQRRLMNEIPYTGMVVSSDCGDSLDVHPRNKKPIGERLARWALSNTYKYDFSPSGPLFKKAYLIDNKGSVVVSFDYSRGISASNKKNNIIGFELAEYDGLYFPANAETNGMSIVLHSPKVKNPQYIRYGWEPFTRANLVNADNLPASTFKAKVDDITIPNYPIVHGVSAPFAGFINNWIIVAGGCNFPNIPASNGGKKVFYNEIYAINIKNKKDGWTLIGRLPNNVAYGATVVMENVIYMIGGENEKGKLNSVYRVAIDEKTCKAEIEVLPSIPERMSNISGCPLDKKIYIAGTGEHGNRNRMYYFDSEFLSQWKKLPSYPGNTRLQNTLLGDGKNKLYLIGGYQPASKKKAGVVLNDILLFNVNDKSWKKMGNLPLDINGNKRCFVGGSGVLHNGYLVLAGGVNYSIFNDAINGRAPKDYLNRPIEWYQFNDDILLFNLNNKKWTIIENVEGMAKAGGVLLKGEYCYYMICGESKPGIRSRRIITIPFDYIQKGNIMP